MKNQLGSSRMDTVLKMLLIAFISLLAFSSGVYFGKQMSDSDYKMKDLQSDFSHTSTQFAKNKDLDVDPEEAIVDEEVAALSDKFVNAEKDDLESVANNVSASQKDSRSNLPARSQSEEARKIASAPQDSRSSDSAKPDLSVAHQAAVRVANNAAPTEAKKPAESRVPTSLPKTVGASSDVEFTVQVASYPTADAAKTHANKLVQKGFPAFPVEATVKGRTWYRVSVGSFKTMKEATQYRAQILNQSDIQSAIVQRIQR